MILLEREDEEEEHFLSMSRRDDPDTRLGFLKLLQVLFHHCKCFSWYHKHFVVLLGHLSACEVLFTTPTYHHLFNNYLLSLSGHSHSPEGDPCYLSKGKGSIDV